MLSKPSVWTTCMSVINTNHDRKAFTQYSRTDDDYNWSCVAESYIDGVTEFAYFEQAKASDASAYRWENNDFIWHFYMGDGQELTLAEIGHFDEIINQYAYLDGNEGAYRRLADQIADAASSCKLPYDFSFNYDFSTVEFSHGNSTVSGEFNGAISRSQQMLNIEGVANFKFKDIFTDAVDMRSMSAWIREQPDRIRRLLQRFGEIYGIGDSPQGDEIEIDEDAVSAVFFAISELGGTAYRITGEWEANFKAAVLIDRDKSQYIGHDEEFNQWSLFFLQFGDPFAG